MREGQPLGDQTRKSQPLADTGGRQEGRRFPPVSAALHACLVPVGRVTLGVDRTRFAADYMKRFNPDDRIVRCDEVIKMSVILLMLFIAVALAVHEGMLH